MNEQERQVIDDIFRRLEQVANQPRDPEAERFIAEKLRQQPYAPYAMAQAVFVQEQALTNLQAENERLRAELEQASRQPPSGGFLSSIFGMNNVEFSDNLWTIKDQLRLMCTSPYPPYPPSILPPSFPHPSPHPSSIPHPSPPLPTLHTR